MLFFEVLVSQIMRDPDRLYYPYRYSDMKKKPFFASIKAVPGMESETRGLMFERVLDVVSNTVLRDEYNSNDERTVGDIESLFKL